MVYILVLIKGNIPHNKTPENVLQEIRDFNSLFLRFTPISEKILFPPMVKNGTEYFRFYQYRMKVQNKTPETKYVFLKVLSEYNVESQSGWFLDVTSVTKSGII